MMEQRKYDLATAKALFELVSFPESWEGKDDGIFVTDGFRAFSPRDHVYDWVPAYDMDWPDAPNPMTAPALPIPFTANELAACMLDGCGRSIQDAVGIRIGYALNGEALKQFTLGGRWAREALQSAYSLAEKAQTEVGAFDYDEQHKTHVLLEQASDARDKAIEREGVFENGIDREEANRRLERAVASVADLKARAQQADVAVKTKWFAWRKSMVRQLLRPQQADTQPQAVKVLPVDTGAAPMASVQASEPRPAATSPQFVMTKAAMIEQHKHEWPTIERDMSDANRNGLNAAKAGVRGWNEAKAKDWAHANNRLNRAHKPAQTLNVAMNSMASLPSRKHTLKS